MRLVSDASARRINQLPNGIADTIKSMTETSVAEARVVIADLRNNGISLSRIIARMKPSTRTYPISNMGSFVL